MPTIPNVRPRVLKRRLALVGLGGLLAAAVVTMPAAKADGVLSHAEASYVDRYHGAVCSVLRKFPSEAGVMGVVQGIMSDGWAADSAVDIVNASSQLYCTDMWPLLVAIGKDARGESKSYVA